MLILEIIICICFFIPLYTIVLYPVLLPLLSSIFKHPVNLSDDIGKPEISILISVYNEEDYIEDAVRSIYECNYPKDKINLLIGSDGSTDNTDEIIERLKNTYSNIQTFRYNRSGKNGVLNQLINQTKTDLIFFMDADLRISKDSLDVLVKYFSDENVGAVQSHLEMISEQDSDNAGRVGETKYQKYETSMRLNESKINSAVNALGTLYGVRRSNLTFIPTNKVMDDLFNVSYTIYCKKRVIYTTDTKVFEVRKKSIKDELLRRVKIGRAHV